MVVVDDDELEKYVEYIVNFIKIPRSPSAKSDMNYLINLADYLLLWLLDCDSACDINLEISSGFYIIFSEIFRNNQKLKNVGDLLKSVNICISDGRKVDIANMKIDVLNSQEMIRLNYVFVKGFSFYVLNREAEFYEMHDDPFENLNNIVLGKLEYIYLKRANFSLLCECCKLWIQAIRRLSNFLEIKSDRSMKDIINFSISIVADNFGNASVETESVIFECMDLQRTWKCRNFRIIDDYILNIVMKEMSWTIKRKYYILKLILQYYNKRSSFSFDEIFYSQSIDDGLLISIHNKHTLNAGLQLFKFCLENIEKNWHEFTQRVIKSILISDNMITKENFIQYWFPFYCKKDPKFPVLFYESMNQFTESSMGSSCPYLMLSVLKKCREDGVILPIMENDEKFIAEYLPSFYSFGKKECPLVFDILCRYHKPSVLTSAVELESVLTFLIANANTDHTAARKSMISSFEVFVLRLRCSVLRILKHFPSSQCYQELQAVVSFLQKVNHFIISCIEPGSNYQRKVFGLNVYEVLMTHVSHSSHKRKQRKSNLNDKKEIFANFLREVLEPNFTSDTNCIALLGCLLDSCSEIRETALQLLIIYFDTSAIESFAANLFKESLALSKNPIFYKRNSAACVMFALVSLLSKRYTSATIVRHLGIEFSDGNGILEYILQTVENQLVIVKTDLFKSAVSFPIDWSLDLLIYLHSRKGSLEWPVIYTEKIITLLEELVPYLLESLSTNEKADYAPSFEEMSIALDNVIKHSTVSTNNREYGYQLSDANQLLINYIWTTLKVCCKLSSMLVINEIATLIDKQVIRCSNIVVKILRLCRHKGAIEAAAVALSDITKQFTKMGVNCKWLESSLIEVFHLINNKFECTISRRSAGLSLLIQSIVGSDCRNNKPLFDICWSHLSAILKNVNYEKMKQNLNQELPQTQALHFLKGLVADCRLKVYFTPYMEDIIILCLRILSTHIWTIRNASLQLFGVVLPKLVGQRSFPSSFHNNNNNKLYEELFDTMPQLSDYIVVQLQNAVGFNSTFELTSQSNIAPILIILNSVNLGSFSLLKSSARCQLVAKRRYTRQLFRSKISFIRNLASKAYVCLHCWKEIPFLYRNLLRYATKCMKNRIENSLHGCLLALKYITVMTHPNDKFKNNKLSLHSNVVGNVSPVNMQLLYELGLCSYIPPKSFSCFKHRIIIGYNERVKLSVDMSLKTDKDFYSLVDIKTEKNRLIQYNNNSSCFLFAEKFVTVTWLKRLKFWINNLPTTQCYYLFIDIQKYIITSKNIDDYVIKNIFKRLISLISVLKRSSCIRDLINLQNDINLHDIFEIILYKLNNPYRHFAMGLAVMSGLIILYKNVPSCISDLIYSIYKISDANVFDSKVRLNVVNTLCNLSEILDLNEHNINGIYLWRTLMKLLQDDESVIRSRAVKCVRNFLNFTENNFVLEEIDYISSNVCLAQLFKKSVLEKFMSKSEIVDVLSHLLFDDNRNTEIDITNGIVNPFYAGSNNYYSEEVKIIHYLYETLINEFQEEFLKSKFDVNLLVKYTFPNENVKHLLFDADVYLKTKKHFCRLMIIRKIALDYFENRNLNIISEMEETFHFSYYNNNVTGIKRTLT